MLIGTAAATRSARPRRPGDESGCCPIKQAGTCETGGYGRHCLGSPHHSHGSGAKQSDSLPRMQITVNTSHAPFACRIMRFLHDLHSPIARKGVGALPADFLAHIFLPAGKAGKNMGAGKLLERAMADGFWQFDGRNRISFKLCPNAGPRAWERRLGSRRSKWRISDRGWGCSVPPVSPRSSPLPSSVSRLG